MTHIFQLVEKLFQLLLCKKVGETEQIKNFNRWMEAFKGWEESAICRVFALKEGGPELDLQGPHKENRTKTITTTKDVMVCVTPVWGGQGQMGSREQEALLGTLADLA